MLRLLAHRHWLIAAALLASGPVARGDVLADMVAGAAQFSEQGEHDQALINLKWVLRMQPDHFEALVTRGVILMRQREFGAARDALTRALAVRPDAADARCFRGEVASELEEWDESLADLDAAIRADPARSRPFVVRAYVRANRRDWEGSLADCARAIELKTDEVDVHQTEALCHAFRRDFALATAALDRAIALDDKRPALFYNRAMVAVLDRRYDAALADLDRTLTFLGTAALYQVRGDVAFLAGDLARALADHAEYLRFYPCDPAGWMKRARLHALLGQDEGARAAVDEAITLVPTLAPAHQWYDRGDIALLGKHPDRAVAAFDEAVRLDPDDGAIRRERALARWRAGDPAGALADLELAARACPADPELEFARARILATVADPKLRDGRAALVLATQAVERTGQANATALDVQASAYAALGKFPSAIEAAEAGLKLLSPDRFVIKDVTLRGRKLDLDITLWTHDPAAVRREREAALAGYRAGQASRRPRADELAVGGAEF